VVWNKFSVFETDKIKDENSTLELQRNRTWLCFHILTILVIYLHCGKKPRIGIVIQATKKKE
jgi:hypothetical protein